MPRASAELLRCSNAPLNADQKVSRNAVEAARSEFVQALNDLLRPYIASMAT